MKTTYVEYHSKAWDDLLRLRETYRDGVYGWTTWEVIDFNNTKLAKMVWTRF